MAVLFCLRMSMDAAIAPKQPWHMEGRWLMSADDKPIMECVKTNDGKLVAGMMTGANHINNTFHRLARLILDAGKEGWESNSGKRLKTVIVKLMQMEADGKMPRLDPPPREPVED